jgi:hypothetical protein
MASSSQPPAGRPEYHQAIGAHPGGLGRADEELPVTLIQQGACAACRLERIVWRNLADPDDLAIQPYRGATAILTPHFSDISVMPEISLMHIKGKPRNTATAAPMTHSTLDRNIITQRLSQLAIEKAPLFPILLSRH